MANLTLAHRNNYLEYLKAGIKQDSLTTLRTAPISMSALFPDKLISKAEEEIRHHEDRLARPGWHTKYFNVITLTVRLADNIKSLTGRPVHLPGNS